MINPLRDPDAFDHVVFAGARTPGLAEVSGAGNPREWEVLKAHGQSGATVKFTGEGLAKFTVRLFLWLPEHFDEWEVFRPTIAKPGEALDVEHPLLEELGIKAAAVEDETQWSQPQPGIFAKDLKCLQYRAPKPALNKPAGSKAGSGGDAAGATAQDKYDQMISDLSAQVKDLA
jgi:hypothetical protein